jgi:hypothetical protein
MVKVAALALCLVSSAGISGCKPDARMVIMGRWYYLYDSNGNVVRLCLPPGNECEIAVKLK